MMAAEADYYDRQRRACYWDQAVVEQQVGFVFGVGACPVCWFSSCVCVCVSGEGLRSFSMGTHQVPAESLTSAAFGISVRVFCTHMNNTFVCVCFVCFFVSGLCFWCRVLVLVSAWRRRK